MGIKEAIVIRIKKLCIEKNIAFNTLAILSGVTPSTVYSLLDNSRKDIGVLHRFSLFPSHAFDGEGKRGG